MYIFASNCLEEESMMVEKFLSCLNCLKSYYRLAFSYIVILAVVDDSKSLNNCTEFKYDGKTLIVCFKCFQFLCFLLNTTVVEIQRRLKWSSTIQTPFNRQRYL